MGGFSVSIRWISRYWDELRDARAGYIWKEIAPRIVADLICVNTSMVLAFMVWYLFNVAVLKTPQQQALSQRFRSFVLGYAAFWSVLAILVFHLHGFYTRTRGYARRYKAFVVLRAVSFFIILFVFADVFVFHTVLASRGALFLSWLLLLATVGGARFAKHIFVKLYHVEPRHLPRKPEHVLVVGGAGYLGSVLVPLLLERGYKTRVLDSLMFGKESLRSAESFEDCELLTGDVRDIRVVVQAMKGCDAVIDLAAIVGDPACEENPQLATEINRAATRMLVDVSRGHGIQRFLFASTCSVYGASDYLMDEHALVAPISLYAQTKVDSENLLLETRGQDFHPVILRLATLFGTSPRPRFDLVVNLLTARAVRTGKITIYNGEQWRPFMHVHDAASAFVTCLEADPYVTSGEIFNAGSYSLNCRLSGLAERIAALIPELVVEHVENTDRRNYRVSFEKIQSRLNFTCKRTLEDGIRELAEMVRTSPVDDFTTAIFNNRVMTQAFALSADSGRSSFRLLEALTRTE
jgi:nucleoside-diphosphate-sugar epimerase